MKNHNSGSEKNLANKILNLKFIHLAKIETIHLSFKDGHLAELPSNIFKISANFREILFFVKSSAVYKSLPMTPLSELSFYINHFHLYLFINGLRKKIKNKTKEFAKIVDAVGTDNLRTGRRRLSASQRTFLL